MATAAVQVSATSPAHAAFNADTVTASSLNDCNSPKFADVDGGSGGKKRVARGW